MSRRENYLKLRGSKREQAGENFIARRVIICVTHRAVTKVRWDSHIARFGNI